MISLTANFSNEKASIKPNEIITFNCEVKCANPKLFIYNLSIRSVGYENDTYDELKLDSNSQELFITYAYNSTFQQYGNKTIRCCVTNSVSIEPTCEYINFLVEREQGLFIDNLIKLKFKQE